MQVFEMAPAGGRWGWALLAFLLVVFVGAAALVTLSMRTPRFEVSGEGLRIRGNIYGRFIPAAELRGADARTVDLDASPELRPKWKTNGAALPGFKAGWFRLRNGEKALVFLNRARRAAYVPTTSGYSLLLGVNDPDGMVASLRSGR